MMIRRIAFHAAVITLSLSACPFARTPQASTKPQGVVVLNNLDFLTPTTVAMDQTLRQTLVDGSSRAIEMYAESLDTVRFGRSFEPELLALMRKKYSGKSIDVVLARGEGGLDFAARYRDELWPQAAIVFYSPVADATPKAPLRTTGVLIDLGLEGTLNLVRQLHPGVRRLFIVGGTGDADRLFKSRIRSLLGPEETFSVTWLDDRPLPQILEAVSSLQSGDVVLFTSMVRDAEGNTPHSVKVAQSVAASSAVPVYGILPHYLGTGIAGGSVADVIGQGRVAAELALRVLGGESVESISVQPSPPPVCLIDARAVERWNISLRGLPPHCELRFGASALWRDYPWQTAIAAVAVLLQALLIAALLVQRRARRSAEATAQRREQELARSSKLAVVGELTASIAHEINQPLSAILSNADAAEMLLDRRPDRDMTELREILADIRADDMRATEVIRRIRRLLTRHELELEPVDLNEIVRDVIRVLQPEAGRREVQMRAQFERESIEVRGDRVHLRQALLNLAVNGMDAMSATPVPDRILDCSVRTRPDGHAVIEMKDRGHGIAANVLPRIFDPLFTTKREGMGLGLAIVRSIVEAQDGHIFAANNDMGGATFTLTLPLNCNYSESHLSA